MSRHTTIESRVLGERITFVRTGEETGGQVLEMEVCYNPQPSWDNVPYHLHVGQDEHFEVVDGEFTVEIAGVKRVYTAGEQFDVPRNTEHVMRNLGSVPATVRWQVRPALQTQPFFEAAFELADRGTLYHPLQFAVFATAYDHVFRLTRQPRMQRRLLPLLAAIGRLMGYRPGAQRRLADVDGAAHSHA